MPLAMPVEISVLWPIPWIAGQKNPSPLKIRKSLSRHSIFDKLVSIHEKTVIIDSKTSIAPRLDALPV